MSTKTSASASITDPDIPAGWTSATLHGGAYDGQHVTVPEDEDRLTFYDAGRAIDYFRPSGKPDFYTIDRLRRVVGGGR